ncbi:MAG: segregation/condensation protein A [Gammaproteobacteria bacterium]|jgi:segregation and condensation protein A|nr:segregation/condensation protein A [Gammaproteobacteria bacterium]
MTQQDEMPFAIVRGEAMTEVPHDLYIPPDAMEVILEAFEGPLDLLLYLIRRQNLDILDIPVAEITKQYMGYIELMQMAQLDLAAEYLVMAAMLAEIKSRMLLPRPEGEDEDDEDPRMALVRRLQEYERYRKAAMDINSLPRVGRELFLVSVNFEKSTQPEAQPDVSLFEMLDAFKEVLARASQHRHFQVGREVLSVRERMTQVLEKLQGDEFIRFEALFRPREGRMGVVVTFMAILELLKDGALQLVQNEPYAPIHVRMAA